MNAELERVLREMCRYVGVAYESVNWSDRDEPYYLKHSWSSAARACFVQWLAEELKKKSVRRALCKSWVSGRESDRKEAARWFATWHGWKVVDAPPVSCTEGNFSDEDEQKEATP